MDRVRTALFDVLSWRVEDTTFLDLFAGTGSVGIEALSRGAAHATFVELSQDMLKIVRENLANTQLADRAELVRGDAFAFLQQARAQGRHFNIIYVAPPQYHGLAARAIADLDAALLTAAGDLVIVQVHPREQSELDRLALTTLRRYDQRRYGSTLLVFYQHRGEQDARTDEQQSAEGGEQPWEHQAASHS
jgi:16S rRNA (guanine(966)-N(2))-methyltransferase RsmD